MAIVTNSRAVPPYTETTPIELTIEVSDQPEYRACYIGIETNGVRQYYFPASDSTSEIEGSIRHYASAEGVFSGRTFSGDYYETTGNTVTEATILVTLNSSFDAVESFSVWRKQEGFYIKEWSAEGGGIPLEYKLSNEMRFAEYYSDVCSALTSYEASDDTYEYTSEVLSYDCNGSAPQVEIIFWPEMP